MPLNSARPQKRTPSFDDDTPVAEPWSCDVCGETFEGQPGGRGLLVWTRSDEVRYEEPPICERCSEKLAMGALWFWAREEDEDE